jgi:hypothetical protein
MEVNSLVVIGLVVVVVAFLVVPPAWTLLAQWFNPTGAKGAYQRRAVSQLLKIKESLDSKGHGDAAKLCRESVVALVCGDDKDETKESAPANKGLFQ